MTERALDDQVLYRLEAGVAWITLNRPEAHNAITPDQRNRVIALLSGAGADLATRVVVLTATGKGFCTGADLRANRSSAARPEGAPDRPVGTVARMLEEGAQRLIAALLDCPKPVIAAVNGTAAGIGAHMAFACDLVLAAEGSKFIEVFVRRGIVPDGGGAYLLPRLIGLHKAKELIFFGDDVPAAEAARLGLVNKVVPADELEGTARSWAERLATGPTHAIGLAKGLLNRSLESDRAAAFRDEAAAQEMAMSTLDANEGIAAFGERRPPVFRGF
ncbi:MAG: enoyl-CoA hydratase/isomerase family protein [Acidimicrobiales bacterium]